MATGFSNRQKAQYFVIAGFILQLLAWLLPFEIETRCDGIDWEEAPCDQVKVFGLASGFFYFCLFWVSTAWALGFAGKSIANKVIVLLLIALYIIIVIVFFGVRSAGWGSPFGNSFGIGAMVMLAGDVLLFAGSLVAVFDPSEADETLDHL